MWRLAGDDRIGGTTREALVRFERTGQSYSGADQPAGFVEVVELFEQ